MTNASSREAFLTSPYRSIKYNSYFATYDRFFAPYRGRKITFVEIGVLDGGSLFMWRDFFGPEARIIGVDLNPAAERWREHGFEIFIGSQSDPDFWSRFTDEVGPIDVVLDDGGHTFAQQIITTEALLPAMADGGVLAVEDTHTSYMSDFDGPSDHSFVSYAKNLVDGINHRSSVLADKEGERRVWGVTFLESFVIFHIERTESERQVEYVDNGAQSLGALDFRYQDSRIVGRIIRRIEKGGWINRNRITRKLLWEARYRLQGLDNRLEIKSLRKFFRH